MTACLPGHNRGTRAQGLQQGHRPQLPSPFGAATVGGIGADLIVMCWMILESRDSKGSRS